jgi:hypothetical protein
VNSTFLVKPAELLDLKPLRHRLFIPGRGVIASFALTARQRYQLSWHDFLFSILPKPCKKPGLPGSTR